MPTGKRVAVIGAGLAGLVAIKSLKEEGFQVTCFEKMGYIGGLWLYRDDDTEGLASVMKTTIINTSKEMGSFSDCPPPAEYANFMHHSVMYEYITSSVKKFDGTKCINFYHEVVKIEQEADYEETGRWKVTCKNTRTGDIVSDVFDCVTVCNGHHVYPNIPTFPGQEEFVGNIMHSHSLKHTRGFEDMRVVVIGTGNSGTDAATELSCVTKQVYLSSRRGTWVLPKLFPGGIPYDATLIRRPLLWALRNLPYILVCCVSETVLNFILDHDFYNLKPTHRLWGQHPTSSDSLPMKLLSGAVVTRGAIKTFTKNGVIFQDEENETPVDAVILCTGYQENFAFLSDDILPVKDNRVKLYKFIFPPNLPHPTLAVIGITQPNGPALPVMEMQCRYAGRVMSGKLMLPTKAEMHADIKKIDDYNKKRFMGSPRHAFEVDFIGYQDELAEEIGAKPNLLKLAITDPKLFWAVFFGPSLPYQYRLQGPHSWDGARNAILTYDERLKKPLRRPGQKRLKRGKKINFVSIIQFVFLFILFWYLFVAVIMLIFKK